MVNTKEEGTMLLIESTDEDHSPGFAHTLLLDANQSSRARKQLISNSKMNIVIGSGV